MGRRRSSRSLRDHLLEAFKGRLDIVSRCDVVLDLVDKGSVGDTPRVTRRRLFPAAAIVSPLANLGGKDRDLRSLSFLPLGRHCVEWASLLSALENSKGLEILRLRSTSDELAVGQVGCGQLEESGRHNCLCHPPRTPAGGTLRPHPNRHRGAMTSDVHFQAITTASYIREPQPP